MVSATPSTYKRSVPKLLASEWAFIDRETDFKDDGNIEALANSGSDFSNKD